MTDYPGITYNASMLRTAATAVAAAMVASHGTEKTKNNPQHILHMKWDRTC